MDLFIQTLRLITGFYDSVIIKTTNVELVKIKDRSFESANIEFK
jgi:hypothetical protein